MLTCVCGEDFSGLDLEINGTFNQQGIVIEHPFIVASIKLILYMVTAVVEAAGSDVATSTLEAVSLGFHLWKVPFFNCLCQGLKRRIE